MFDPSKLDLDLENGENNPESEKKDNENQNENISDIVIEEEKKPEEIENTGIIEEIQGNDILGEIKNSWVVEETIIEKTEEDIVPVTENKTEDGNKTDEEKKPETNNKQDNSLESLLNNVIPDNSIMDSFNSNWKSIIDINISSIKDLLNILTWNNYDFLTIEPNYQDVKIRFFKDSIEKDIKNIKFPIYSQILIKTKSIAKLNIEETEKEQEWVWEVILNSKTYKFISKTSPSNFWEKVFIKLEEINKQIKKEWTKMSVWQIFSFIWTIAFVSLIVWWGFISFVVLNANTVDDVKFFSSIWISLNDINTFILKVVTIIFSILVFLETILLIIFLFKFGLTKKEFKQKKIKYLIFSIIFFIVTFSTATAWMYIDQKIKSLPNWQEMAYWLIQIYDNSKLTSERFDKEWALLKDTTNLIWPIQVKFDLTYFADKEIKSWMKINKYIWDFWWGESVETQTPTAIKNFDKKWNYKISLIIEEIDLKGATIEKVVEDIPNIELSYVVEIEEKKLNNWWKQLKIDASSLKELWKIQWYSLDEWVDFDIWKSIAEGYILNYWKPIFEESIIWMYIKRNDKESEELDKVFIITGEIESSLNWEISYNRSTENDLEFEFKVDNVSVDSWNWFVEKYKWTIWGKEKTNIWDIEKPTESSKYIHKFETTWIYEVKVLLEDSAWNTKELKTTIDVKNEVKLKGNLKILNKDQLITDYKYDKKNNEYYIDWIWTPTKLTIDAKEISTDNYVYNLDKVNWDFDSNWDIDESWKNVDYDLNSVWNHNITVEYIFVHRKEKDNKVIIKEKLFIEAVKKEADINFTIEKDSEYAPVIVKLDWSKSQVKDDDIVKFLWDFWDWETDTRDSVVQWHKYSSAWDYTIKLTIVTESWKEYSTKKQLVLKPKPQSVKIGASMKTSDTEHWIDFSSNESQWQIVEYFWDFWDWSTSTEANPTHEYKKPWTYTVKLKVDFINNNVMEDEMEIKIIE